MALVASATVVPSQPSPGPINSASTLLHAFSMVFTSSIHRLSDDNSFTMYAVECDAIGMKLLFGVNIVTRSVPVLVAANAAEIGATELTLKAGTSGTIKAGDYITLAGDSNKYVVTRLQ